MLDGDHRLLAVWAAECAEHALPLFEALCPEDRRPRLAVEAAHAWVRGDISMMEARCAAGAAQDAAREVKARSEAAKCAALAAGQAAAVAHVAAHELGAAAYAILAAMAAAPKEERENARRQECEWQRDRLPEKIRALVIEDEGLRNDLCWFVFSGD